MYIKAVSCHPAYLTYVKCDVEYITGNAGLDEGQAGIKIAGKSINSLIYADDTTTMAESKEDLESLNEGERGESKSWLKTQHSETKIMASGPIISWLRDGGNNGNSG